MGLSELLAAAAALRALAQHAAANKAAIAQAGGIEQEQQRFGLDIGEHDMRDAGSNRCTAVEHGRRRDLTKPITEAHHEAISQCAEAHDIGVASGNRGRGSCREGGRRR